jgi:hypothetical protein
VSTALPSSRLLTPDSTFTTVYRLLKPVYASGLMGESTTKPCPRCGASASGNFCSACGAGLGHRTCTGCQAAVSVEARFCHRCGQAVTSPAGTPAAASERRAWIFSGVACVLLVGAIAYHVSDASPAPVTADMANAGSATGVQGAGPAPVGPAPDISAMTPRERYDRLFNRIMQAAERRDSAEVRRFTPMALGAYDQLDSRDADARYHAAVLHLQVGNFDAARALADTILIESPRHLFGYLVRGQVAELQGADGQLRQARRDFLAQYASQMATKRVEYLEHQPVLDEFKTQAEGVRR